MYPPPPTNTKGTTPIGSTFWVAATNGIAYNLGHVGINTRAPLYALDVPLGTISANKFRMTDGAANGKVLMSDSDGTAYWATPSSGGSGDSPWQTSTDNHIYYNPGYSPGAGGNVGIGTDAPLAKLDIDGDLRIKETLSFNGANNGNITFGTTTQGRSLKITSNWSDAYKGSIQGMVINAAGNVGIGKDNPSVPLDVNGKIKAIQLEVSGTTTSASLYISGTTTTNNFKMLNGRGDGKILQSDAYGNASWVLPESGSTSPWDTDANGNIDRYTGRVSIGGYHSSYQNADFKLAVNGTIGSKKVVVTLDDVDWPDFVFNENYILPKLLDIESYVKENKHLPNVPSAQEVKENGLDLGAMNAILLQKIEELTLMMIAQQKEIDALSEKVNH